jgi:DNA-binding MarR family transcriptional regulator
MTDNIDLGPPQTNIRTLLYFLSEMVDQKLAERRKGTPYERVRPSDIRVFVTAAREPKSISDIARGLGISRQSAQASISRLVKLGVVELETRPINKREKRVLITPRGVLAGKTARQQIDTIESEMAATIGTENLETMRSHLIKLVSTTS